MCFLFAATASAEGDPDILVRLDMLDGGRTTRGNLRVAMKLTMAEGWKTYWRQPGVAGIPPSFDWRGSRNVADIAISWPTPVVFELAGLQSIGYKGQLVLPIEVTPARPGQPVRLRGQIDIGVCNEVCVPASLSFDHEIDPDAPPDPSIEAALARQPRPAGAAGVRAARCRVSPLDDGIRLEARIDMPSAGGREIVVIEPGNPMLWATETQARRKGRTLVAATEILSNDEGPISLDRSRVRFTVLGERYAVDIRGCRPG